jgi:hypothetical protein
MYCPVVLPIAGFVTKDSCYFFMRRLFAGRLLIGKGQKINDIRVTGRGVPYVCLLWGTNIIYV